MKTSAAEKFFFLNGGYSWDPNTQTKAQGKRQSAKDHAKAEAMADKLGWRFEWSEDPEPYKLGDAETEHPDEVLCVAMYDENGKCVDSLGGIGFVGSFADKRLHGRIEEAAMALELCRIRGLI